MDQSLTLEAEAFVRKVQTLEEQNQKQAERIRELEETIRQIETSAWEIITPEREIGVYSEEYEATASTFRFGQEVSCQTLLLYIVFPKINL
jgi:hypothetical protein